MRTNGLRRLNCRDSSLPRLGFVSAVSTSCSVQPGLNRRQLRNRGHICGALVLLLIALLLPATQVFVTAPSPHWVASAHGWSGNSRSPRVHRRFFDKLFEGDKESMAKNGTLLKDAVGEEYVYKSAEEKEAEEASAPAVDAEAPKAEVAKEEKVTEKAATVQPVAAEAEEAEVEDAAEPEGAKELARSPSKQPVTEVKVSEVRDAKITMNDPRYSRQGVMVDIGCEKKARLNVSEELAKMEARGNLMRGKAVSVVVDSVDYERGLIDVSLVDAEKTIASWAAARTSLESLQVGSTVDGVVRFKVGKKVLLDIGAAADALLITTKDQAMQLKLGEPIRGMKIESVDAAADKLTVTVEDSIMESLLAGRPKKEKRRTSESPALVGTGKSKGKKQTKKQLSRLLSIGGLRDIPLRSGKDLTFTFDMDDPAVKKAFEQKLNFNWQLTGMDVTSVDVEAGKIQLSLGAAAKKANNNGKKQTPSPAPKKLVDRNSDGTVRVGKTKVQVEMPPVKVGDRISNGTVRVVGSYGVFVDIGLGFGKDAKLNVPKNLSDKFRFAEEFKNLQVVEVRKDTGRVVVDLDGGEAAVQAHLAGQPERRPVSALRVGEAIEGYVQKKQSMGTFVDIGCIKSARLSISQDAAKRLQLGDLLKNLEVESVDVEKYHIQVRIVDPSDPS